MEDWLDQKHMHPPRRNAVGSSPSMLTQEKRLRMVVLGASGVGKTQLVSRFLDRSFNQSYLPTAEEFHRTKYIIRGHTYQLDILDTAGQTISPVMHNLTLLTGDLFLVVYSVTERGSWERAKDIVESIEEVTRDPERTNKSIERSFKNLLLANGGTVQCKKFENGIQERTKSSKNTTPIPILIVGNQCDACNVQVQAYEAVDWIKRRTPNPACTIDHIIASAKTNYNVQFLYDRLFAMSHLPAELSPNMHRRVPESEYFVNTISQYGRKSSSKKDGRPKSAEFSRISIKSVGRRKSQSGNGSINGSWSGSSSDNEEGSAIASITPNQRRPSVDTEVLLAITKVRAYAMDSERKKKSKMPFSTGKIKNQMKKLKISSHN